MRTTYAIAAAVLCALAVTATERILTARAQPSGIELTVSVMDRALDTPMPGVRVRVSQAGPERVGVTGANGSVTFQALLVGAARVSSERDGYIRRPEVTDAALRAGANAVRMTLLAEVNDGTYFQQAGAKVELEAARLPVQERESFYRREWGRIQLLRPEYQLPAVVEMKGGRPYLASDDRFMGVLKRSGVSD